MNKHLTGLIVGVVILVVGLYIGANYFGLTNVTQNISSTAGTTNSTAKIASVSLDFSTTTPTTVSDAGKLYNSDATDRIVTEIDYYLSGLGTFSRNATGVANLTFTMATSTGIYLAPTPNLILSTTQATSSAIDYVASTTPGKTVAPQIRVWASGTYLNLFTNATSSTAGGTLVVKYFAN